MYVLQCFRKVVSPLKAHTLLNALEAYGKALGALNAEKNIPIVCPAKH